MWGILWDKYGNDFWPVYNGHLGRLTKWSLYTGDLYMKGFDYSTKYCTLVVNKKKNCMLCFVCYFVPVVMLFLFTFIVDEISQSDMIWIKHTNK